MSLKCPRCEETMSLWEIPKYARIARLFCRKCDLSLSLDDKGIWAVRVPIAIAMIIAVFLALILSNELLAILVVIIGFVLSAYSGNHYGTLIAGPDKEPNHR